MKMYFAFAVLLGFCCSLYAQQPEEQLVEKNQIVKLITGLPPAEFFDRLNTHNESYTYAILKSELFRVTTHFLKRNNTDGTESYYVVYEEEEGLMRSLKMQPDSSKGRVKYLSGKISIDGKSFIISCTLNDQSEVKYFYTYLRTPSNNIKIKFSMGIQAEGVFIPKEYHKTLYQMNAPSIHSGYRETSLNLLLSAILRMKIGSWNAIELRPSSAFFEKPFQALQLGLHYKTYWFENLFSTIGIIGHLGLEGSHGAFSYHQGDSGFIYSFGIGIGVYKSLSFTLNAYSISNVDSYESLYESYRYNADTGISKKWKDWLFSFGLEYNY